MHQTIYTFTKKYEQQSTMCQFFTIYDLFSMTFLVIYELF